MLFSAFAEFSGFLLLCLLNHKALTKYRNRSLAPANADIATSWSKDSFWAVLCQSQRDALCACALLFLIGSSVLGGAGFVVFDGTCLEFEELDIKRRDLCGEGQSLLLNT